MDDICRLGYSSGVEHLPSIYSALNVIPSTPPKKNTFFYFIKKSCIIIIPLCGMLKNTILGADKMGGLLPS